MDRLHAMKVFTRVVETSSFTRAADTLGMPRASVTVTIQQLEEHLKARLLQRTTRRVNLTPDGAGYYERCVRILADIEETEGSFNDQSRAARGKLRVDMPGALGRIIVMPKIHEFYALYPEIDLMLGFGDRLVDLIQEGVDCAIRVGALEDSSLVARRVGLYQAITVASPAYLERYGTPATIEELNDHVATNYFSSRTGRIMSLTFEVNGQPTEVRMKGNIAVNDAEAYLESGLDGIGIIQAARFMALPHLKSGRLVEILPQWKPPPAPISTIYPHNRHLSLTVRVFVDWIAKLFVESALLADPGTRPARRPAPRPVNVEFSALPERENARMAEEAI
ncbi:LysR family transcriptional regulator [Paraburkholderia caffeinilytica]|uniref:LysR family transcriptional regulator n=1 Tax=Paraburkholderia caffeinilytica TaxID=1761016 RepID=UPI0038B9A1B8